MKLLSFECHRNDSLRYIVCCLFKIYFNYQRKYLYMHLFWYFPWTQLIIGLCMLMMLKLWLKICHITSAILRSRVLLSPVKWSRMDFLEPEIYSVCHTRFISIYENKYIKTSKHCGSKLGQVPVLTKGDL